MTDHELLKAIARGTTRDPARMTILYRDENQALVKHPGGRLGNHAFERTWYAPKVESYDLRNPKIVGGIWWGVEVWNCARDRNGPLTPKRLTAMIASIQQIT